MERGRTLLRRMWYSPLVNWARKDHTRRVLVVDLHFVPFTVEEQAGGFEIPVRP